MPQVPEERPQPDEVPYREVPHEEPLDPNAPPWETGRYSVGSVREWDWWGGKAAEEALAREMREREKARAKLGGFGFRSSE